MAPANLLADKLLQNPYVHAESTVPGQCCQTTKEKICLEFGIIPGARDGGGRLGGQLRLWRRAAFWFCSWSGNAPARPERTLSIRHIAHRKKRRLLLRHGL